MDNKELFKTIADFIDEHRHFAGEYQLSNIYGSTIISIDHITKVEPEMILLNSDSYTKRFTESNIDEIVKYIKDEVEGAKLILKLAETIDEVINESNKS